MSLGMRIFFFALIGIIAGILAWPLAELAIYYQAKFPSQLILSIAVGVAVGLFMGACFGTFEGITSHSGPKLRSGIIMGLLIGIISGVVGILIGQASLIFLVETFFHSPSTLEMIGSPVSKALGWAAFGICIGMIEGIRSRSLAKIKNGIIGGFIGGLLGGLAYAYIPLLAPDLFYTRLIGLVILGLFICLFYGFVESKLAQASLFLLNGRNKGKEFLLSQRRNRIGSAQKYAIALSGYRDIDHLHAVIRHKKKEFTIKDNNAKTGTFVNDKKIGAIKLQNGDVIRTGEAQFLFKLK